MKRLPNVCSFLDYTISFKYLKQKKLFGASTEVSGQIKGQMTLFGTAQELTRQLFEEQEKLTIRNYTRTARKPGVRKEMLAGLPKIVEEYEIPAEDECSRCGEC